MLLCFPKPSSILIFTLKFLKHCSPNFLNRSSKAAVVKDFQDKFLPFLQSFQSATLTSDLFSPPFGRILQSRRFLRRSHRTSSPCRDFSLGRPPLCSASPLQAFCTSLVGVTPPTKVAFFVGHEWPDLSSPKCSNDSSQDHTEKVSTNHLRGK